MPPPRAMRHRSRVQRSSTAIRAFDLFCGAGGSSVGARSAGVRVIGGVERAELAAKVYLDNFPGAKIYRQDIRSLSAARVAREVGPIDLLLASPECTNHTIAKGKGRSFGHVQSPVDAQGRYGKIATADFIDHVAAMFDEAAARWLTGDEPFTARPHSDAPVFTDYDQLMRLDEWIARGGPGVSGDE